MSDVFYSKYNIKVKPQDFITAFHNAPIGIALIGLKGEWIAVNKKICDLLGYSEDELLKTDFQAITHPDDLESDLELLQQLFENKIPSYEMEKRYFHKNGDIIWVCLTVGVSRNDHGDIEFYISQIMDITEQKNARIKIEQSNMLNDMVLQNIPDFVFVKDHDYKIVKANQAFLNIYPEDIRDHVIGTTTVEKYDKEEADAFLKQDRIAFEKGQSEIEETLIFPDGKKRTLSTKKVRFEDSQKNAYILAVARDISDLKEIQRNLIIQKDQLLLAEKTSNVGHWQYDIQEQHIFWSDEIYNIHDVNKEEYTPHISTAVEFYHPNDREMVEASLANTIENKEEFTFELRLVTAKNRLKIVNSVGHPECDENGNVISIFGTFQDITAQKNAERALLIANKELEKFAYIVSHDLRAPLRGIDNLAQWISEDLEGVMPSDTADKMQMLKSRVKRLEAMLTDILDFSKAGKVVETPKELDLNVLLTRVIENTSSGTKFAVHIDQELPTIISPITALEQVFTNIISNAIKHHDKESGNVTVSCIKKNDFLTFRIKDDGPGIPKQFQERVFEMFQTLKPRDHTEGTGLGMPIIKKLVEGQDGEVKIVSPSSEADDRGTDIIFTWPAEPQIADVDDVENG